LQPRSPHAAAVVVAVNVKLLDIPTRSKSLIRNQTGGMVLPLSANQLKDGGSNLAYRKKSHSQVKRRYVLQLQPPRILLSLIMRDSVTLTELSGSWQD